jgi:MFS family permease
MAESDLPGEQPAAAARRGLRQGSIVLYAAIAFLFWSSLYVYMPTLPIYIESKSSSLALVGVVLSMYGLWQAIIRLPLGIASALAGRRKPFIVVGIALSGLGAWIMAASGGVQGLIVGRAVTGLAAGTWVLIIVTFSSFFDSNESVKAASILTLTASIGRVISTGVTGTLNELGGYRLAFYVALGAAALAIITLLPTRERKQPPQPGSVSGIGRLITRSDVLTPSLLNAVNQYVTWSVTFGFLPILAKQIGVGDVMQSAMVSVYLLIAILGSLFAATTARRIGAPGLALVSFVALTLGAGLAGLASSLALLFAVQLCMGIAWGIGNPVLMGMSIEHVEEAERTTAMGLHQAVYGIGMFAGSGVSGFLADALGIRLTFLLSAGVCLLLTFFVPRWLGKTSTAQESSAVAS